MTNPIESLPDTTRRGVWIALLTVASVALSLVFACATPFAAFVALAAVNMRRGDVLALAVATWLANQAVGYGLLHYPLTANSFEWGGAIGVAVVVAAEAAIAAQRPFARGLVTATVAAFAAAFAVFELVLYGFSFVLGDAGAFTLAIVGDILKANVLALLGLGILFYLAVMVGLARGNTTTVAARH
jgi:hypothetical protein